LQNSYFCDGEIILDYPDRPSVIRRVLKSGRGRWERSRKVATGRELIPDCWP